MKKITSIENKDVRDILLDMFEDRAKRDGRFYKGVLILVEDTEDGMVPVEVCGLGKVAGLDMLGIMGLAYMITANSMVGE